MVRMGCYTGKLYDDSVDVKTIKECCQVLNFKEPVFDDEELVIRKRIELKQRCVGCNGCEEAQRNIVLNKKEKEKEKYV